MRPEQVDTGVNRGRVRTKIRFDDVNEDNLDVETETIAPPTTAGRGRTRSRFSGTRSRVPTSSRVVVTGTRKRQRVRGDNINTEDIDNNLPEEDRSPDIGSLSVRRKVNRIPNFTSRRKPINPTEIPVTRIPPRRRLRPFTVDDDQETVGFETESPELVLETIENEDDDGGISVLPVSTVRFTFYNGMLQIQFLLACLSIVLLITFLVTTNYLPYSLIAIHTSLLCFDLNQFIIKPLNS